MAGWQLQRDRPLQNYARIRILRPGAMWPKNVDPRITLERPVARTSGCVFCPQLFPAYVTANVISNFSGLVLDETVDSGFAQYTVGKFVELSFQRCIGQILIHCIRLTASRLKKDPSEFHFRPVTEGPQNS